MWKIETDPVLNPGPPVRLFDVAPFTRLAGREFDVAPDGRFLFLRPRQMADTADQRGLVFVQNWFEELKARVPVP